jgi:hypothetical protein
MSNGAVWSDNFFTDRDCFDTRSVSRRDETTLHSPTLLLIEPESRHVRGVVRKFENEEEAPSGHISIRFPVVLVFALDFYP